MEPHHDIPIPLSIKPRNNPGQIRAIDTADDRLEIANLLKHLPPRRRVAYLEWACSQAYLPGCFIHPKVGPETYALLRQSGERREADVPKANEQLTIEILLTMTHLWLNYALDSAACLKQLVLMARGKD